MEVARIDIFMEFLQFMRFRRMEVAEIAVFMEFLKFMRCRRMEVARIAVIVVIHGVCEIKFN